jgi:hypothetical protein
MHLRRERIGEQVNRTAAIGKGQPIADLTSTAQPGRRPHCERRDREFQGRGRSEEARRTTRLLRPLDAGSEEIALLD